MNKAADKLREGLELIKNEYDQCQHFDACGHAGDPIEEKCSYCIASTYLDMVDEDDRVKLVPIQEHYGNLDDDPVPNEKMHPVGWIMFYVNPTVYRDHAHKWDKMFYINRLHLSEVVIHMQENKLIKCTHSLMDIVGDFYNLVNLNEVEKDIKRAKARQLVKEAMKLYPEVLGDVVFGTESRLGRLKDRIDNLVDVDDLTVENLREPL